MLRRCVGLTGATGVALRETYLDGKTAIVVVVPASETVRRKAGTGVAVLPVALGQGSRFPSRGALTLARGGVDRDKSCRRE